MCGRYFLTHSAADIAAFFRALPVAATSFAQGENISPTQQILVVTGGDELQLTTMRWGMFPRWSTSVKNGRPIINARSETVTQKPMFRDLIRTNRCVVPASGYYEWPKSRPPRSKPIEISFDGDEPLAMAGLWDTTLNSHRLEERTCVIITTDPATEIAEIHDRMPALLTRSEVNVWLDKSTSVADAVNLLRPWHYDRLAIHDTAHRKTTTGSCDTDKRGLGQQLDLWEDL